MCYYYRTNIPTNIYMRQKNVLPTLSRNIHANLSMSVSGRVPSMHSAHVANLDGNREPLEKVGKGEGFSSC